MYPLVGPIVRNSGGCFLRISEEGLEEYGRIVKKERGIYMGPASAVCIAGFYEALKKGDIRDGNLVLLNTGEGCDRARWFRKAIDA